MSERYDAVVIGSGEGGKFLAWDLAKAGQRVAVVERRWIGGSCPNTNCLPSKNEIWSAEIAHLARNADRYGVETGRSGSTCAAWSSASGRWWPASSRCTSTSTATAAPSWSWAARGSRAPKTVAVDLNAGGERVLTADTIVLNLGTRPAIPDVPGLREAEPLTNIEALELDTLPDHLIVLGGGYVGLELAQAYRRFGSTVTVIERGERIAGREDADVADELAGLLKAEGIALRTGTAVVRVRGRSGDAVKVVVRSSDGESVVAGSHILVAAGRTPNTDGIGLDLAGVAVTERGTIRVDDRLATTAPGIWAIGECAGSPAFTHASADDYRVVRDALKGGGRSTAGRQMPYCLFTDPPLARVGASEAEARASGAAIRVAKLPMRAVLRTRTTGLTDGFMKAVIGPDDRILGFAMMGADAGEVMAAVQVAMLAGLPYTALRDAILAHPTTAEGLNALFAAVPAR